MLNILQRNQGENRLQRIYTIRLTRAEKKKYQLDKSI